MPIHLEAPRHNPGGPDGQGWNRLSVGWTGDNQCALRPTNYQTLVDSHDTRQARWGGHGPCVRPEGDCQSCPIFKRLKEKPTRLAAFGDKVLVRIDNQGRPNLMDKEEKGWDSWAQWWTWDELARLTGWTIGPQHFDEHGEGFWLLRRA